MQVFNPEFVAKVKAKRAKLMEAESPKLLPAPVPRSKRLSARVEAAAEHGNPVLPYWAKTVARNVCARHGLEFGLVSGRCMTPRVVACRDEIFWLLRNDSRRPSYPRIGRWFGRDHSTVITALRRHERRGEKARAA